ncbi:hypothetical protein [Mycoplasma sp. Z473B]|uniref:hypothetical protein n=1 Tax=Mycoplasma sp. Z473B TaxID=3401667 RepID=UPI003AAAEBA5
MAQKEISFLSDLGINFQAFQDSEFNTQKPFKIPKKLYSIMPSAGSEEIFTKTLFSVYNSCNALINNVINLLALKLEYDAAKFIKAAGKERITLLKSAIFNEVNYRFTTQTTPELFNRLTIAPNNAQILGTPRDFYLAEQYLNPIAKRFLEDCEWDRLGVELGAAYAKAFEIDNKVQEFKTELAKNSNSEKEEFKKQILEISESKKTELAQQASETVNNYVQYLKTTTESNASMLDLTFNHLQQQSKETAKSEIKKIDNYSSQAKKEFDSTIEAKAQELNKIKDQKTEEFSSIINSKTQNFLTKEEAKPAFMQLQTMLDGVAKSVDINKNDISNIKSSGGKSVAINKLQKQYMVLAEDVDFLREAALDREEPRIQKRWFEYNSEPLKNEFKFSLPSDIKNWVGAELFIILGNRDFSLKFNLMDFPTDSTYSSPKRVFKRRYNLNSYLHTAFGYPKL